MKLLTNSFKAILFDFGGTLDSDGIAWKERFYPIYRSCGLNLDFKEFEKYFFSSDDALVEQKLKNLSFSKTIYLVAILPNFRSFSISFLRTILFRALFLTFSFDSFLSL